MTVNVCVYAEMPHFFCTNYRTSVYCCCENICKVCRDFSSSVMMFNIYHMIQNIVEHLCELSFADLSVCCYEFQMLSLCAVMFIVCMLSAGHKTQF